MTVKAVGPAAQNDRRPSLPEEKCTQYVFFPKFDRVILRAGTQADASEELRIECPG